MKAQLRQQGLEVFGIFPDNMGEYLVQGLQNESDERPRCPATRIFFGKATGFGIIPNISPKPFRKFLLKKKNKMKR